MVPVNCKRFQEPFSFLPELRAVPLSSDLTAGPR
jgi:hypothetical protein